MRPVLFELPFVNLPIHSYGAMIVVGFLVTIWFGTREVRRRGLPNIVYDLGLVMLLGGLVGARTFYVVLNSDDFVLPCAHPVTSGGVPPHVEGHFSWVESLKIWQGGLVFYGGAISGGLAALFFLRWKRAPVLEFFDAIAPFIPVAMAFGRVGCVLNGCCFGSICAPNSFIGISYPQGVPGAYFLHLQQGLIPSDAVESLPVYPVQLFEVGHDLLICGLLLWYVRGTTPRGAVFPLALILYAAGRFLLEYLRGDNLPIYLWGLTISQVVSLVLAILFLPLFVFSTCRSSKQVSPRAT